MEKCQFRFCILLICLLKEHNCVCLLLHFAKMNVSCNWSIQNNADIQKIVAITEDPQKV